MVGASFSRSIYFFVVDTSVEQDLKLIAEFNSEPNVNHFNGAMRNCADFSRRVINFYFPHGAKPDYLNDFGMTSPKAIARSFSHYGARHPEAHLRVLHFAQLPGTFKRSTECRGGTEQLVRSKKLLVPMLVFADHELPIVAVTYALTGRFNPQRELETYPTVKASDLSQQIKEAKSEKDRALATELKTLENQERAQAVGTPEEWKEYREAFDSVADEAVSKEIIPDRDYLRNFLRHLDHVGTPLLDPSGAVWLYISENSTIKRVRLSASNILDPGSARQTSYVLALARTPYFVKTPKHSREHMPQFKGDWELLQSARFRNPTITTRASLRVVDVPAPPFSTRE